MSTGFQAPDDWGFTGYSNYDAPAATGYSPTDWYDLGSGIDPALSGYGMDIGSNYLPIDSGSYLSNYTLPYDSSALQDPGFLESLLGGNWGDAWDAGLKGVGGFKGAAQLGLGGLSLLGSYLARKEEKDMAKDQFNRAMALKEKDMGLTSNTDLAKVDALSSILGQRGRATIDPRRYAEIVASGNVPPEMVSQPVAMARGGSMGRGAGALGQVQGLLRGGTMGQADEINARLSDGEYVMDAETVSALGDGNTEAGAKRLDEMRELVRRHKRSASAKSIPPPARHPLKYLKGVK